MRRVPRVFWRRLRLRHPSHRPAHRSRVFAPIRDAGRRVTAQSARVLGARLRPECRRRRRRKAIGGRVKRHPKRKTRAPRFAMLPVPVLNTEAVKTLSHAAFRVLTLLAAQFDGRNNGDLGLTSNQAATSGIRSENTFYRALRELEERGLLERTYEASRVPPRPTKYGLAWMPLDDTTYSQSTRTPTHSYREWRAPPRRRRPRRNLGCEVTMPTVLDPQKLRSRVLHGRKNCGQGFVAMLHDRKNCTPSRYLHVGYGVMSRGLGKLQRRVLAELERVECASVDDLAEAIHGEPITQSLARWPHSWAKIACWSLRSCWTCSGLPARSSRQIRRMPTP